MGVFFTLNYMMVAIAGYYLYYPTPQGEMTLDFNPHSGILQASVFIYTLQLMMSYVLVLFIVYSSVEAWLVAAWPATFGTRRGRVICKMGRLAAVASASLVAIVLPNFGDFISLGGALGNSLGIYLLPNLSFLRLANKETGSSGINGLKASFSDRLFSWAIVIFGAVTGAIATVVSFQALISA